MKVLLAVDGSKCSEAAIQEVIRRPWPKSTEVEVFSVAHAQIPLIPDPTMTGLAMHEESLANARERAEAVAATVSGRLENIAGLKVTTKVVDGSPKHAVVDEAAVWGADLLLVGSHGRSAPARFLLGSVSHAAALHAPCSVEIVRCRDSSHVE